MGVKRTSKIARLKNKEGWTQKARKGFRFRDRVSKRFGNQPRPIKKKGGKK